MDSQIVQQDHIVNSHLWQKQFVDIGVEAWSVNGSLAAPRCDDTLPSQRTDDRQIHVAIAGDSLHCSVTSCGASVEPRHGQMKACVVNENELFAREGGNLLTKQLSCFFIPF